MPDCLEWTMYCDMIKSQQIVQTDTFAGFEYKEV